ncbi:hypothetical protein HU200_043164 [Digitaria exilis]|uniref:Plant heme peroxidase family profile domain-containing protein n=1 Tax=Digitaria exilis TaxID=1010633 RepID=A0A835EI02_9POAL|nr:hypothetical protein HU200_043164 [Digitaria exilis]
MAAVIDMSAATASFVFLPYCLGGLISIHIKVMGVSSTSRRAPLDVAMATCPAAAPWPADVASTTRRKTPGATRPEAVLWPSPARASLATTAVTLEATSTAMNAGSGTTVELAVAVAVAVEAAGTALKTTGPCSTVDLAVFPAAVRTRTTGATNRSSTLHAFAGCSSFTFYRFHSPSHRTRRPSRRSVNAPLERSVNQRRRTQRRSPSPAWKEQWASLPPRFSWTDQPGPTPTNPTARPRPPGSRIHGREELSFETWISGDLTPATPDSGDDAGSCPARSATLGECLALASTSASVSLGDTLAGGIGPRQGFIVVVDAGGAAAAATLPTPATRFRLIIVASPAEQLSSALVRPGCERALGRTHTATSPSSSLELIPHKDEFGALPMCPPRVSLPLRHWADEPPRARDPHQPQALRAPPAPALALAGAPLAGDAKSYPRPAATLFGRRHATAEQPGSSNHRSMASLRLRLFVLAAVVSAASLIPPPTVAQSSQQLRTDYYASVCPNLENIVRSSVRQSMAQSQISAPAALRLFFHDCAVQGCDASIMIVNSNGDDEWRSSDNQSLKREGFNTILSAKAAVDSDPQCRNKVSCADILALAAREAVVQVELGRYDGRTSTKSSVVLPSVTFNLDKLNAFFSNLGFNQTEMIALLADCPFFQYRIGTDPTMDQSLASQLKTTCGSNPTNGFAFLDPSPVNFDNAFYRNLQGGRGLLGSDQVLYIDGYASNQGAFFADFVAAITKLGRVGVKTAATGEIRRDCRFPN